MVCKIVGFAIIAWTVVKHIIKKSHEDIYSLFPLYYNVACVLQTQGT